MTGRGILDADMTTLGGWLRDGWRWWIDELATLVPESWRVPGGARADIARFDGARLSGAVPGNPVAITLSPELCLVRIVERPTMAERDIARMLAFDADRILPMPADAMVAAARVVARTPAGMTIAVAGLPIGHARALAESVTAARLRAVRVSVEHASGPIDFLPMLREVGLLARNRSATQGWWAAVGFLFAANVALLVWRDAARVARLEEIVAAQRPAVSVARAIGGRVRAGQRIAQASSARRAAYDPLGVLARVGMALPAGAWVQRYGWSGDTLKLAGYRPRNANVVTALRTAPGFVEVRNTSTDTVAEIPAGQPFDVTARLARVAR